LLKDALEYANPEVRYLIVEALNKVSKMYCDQIFAEKNALEQDPESAENNLKLAESYYDLAHSEVEDHSLNQFYYEQAYFYFSETLKLGELKDPEKIKYGNTLRRLGRQKEALKIFEDLYPKPMSNWDDMPELLGMYFQAGYYSKLSKIAQLCSDSKISTPGEIKKPISLWI